jgi:hypothetical protein
MSYRAPPSTGVDVEHVTVKRFDLPHEAELAARHLEAHGVDSRIDGALELGMAPLLSQAAGAIALNVAAPDAARAQALLEELEVEVRRSRRKRRRQGDTADELAGRALRVSVIGTFICPGVFHVWSWMMLSGARTRSGAKALTTKGRRAYRVAQIINVVAIALLCAALFAGLD